MLDTVALVRTTLLLTLLALAGCAHRAETPEPLSVDEVEALLPAKLGDGAGWAADVVAALETNRLPVDLEHACSVIAVAEQESGFKADPPVPNLPAIARKALEAKSGKLGPLGPSALQTLLSAKAPGTKKTFDQRIDGLRTEQDLDVLFRDILAEQHRRNPALYTAADLGLRLFGSGSLDEHNPVTTAGSMQVSVRFAEAHARVLRRDPDGVRDELYTRPGGLLYGTARLWAFEADYASMQFRFADYNAGVYASRNAAFQQQLAELTGRDLALDGDLLAYDAQGDVASADTKTMEALRAWALATDKTLNVERDARREKTRRFEDTQTWVRVRAAWEAKFHKRAAVARLPVVELHSSKLSRTRSTAWFAESVHKRYEACLSRGRQ